MKYSGNLRRVILNGQPLVGNAANGTVAGNLSLATGASLGFIYTNGLPTLIVTNGALSLISNSVTITIVGSALPPGSCKLISKAPKGALGEALPTSVKIAWACTANSASLQITNGNLYVVVNAVALSVTNVSADFLTVAWPTENINLIFFCDPESACDLGLGNQCNCH